MAENYNDWEVVEEETPTDYSSWDVVEESEEAPDYSGWEAVEDTPPPAGEPSAWAQLSYGFESGSNLYTDARDALEVYFGDGEGYNEDGKWDSLSRKERAERVASQDADELAKEYKDVIAYGEENSAWAKVGAALKFVADPTMLLPGGAVLKAGKVGHSAAKAGWALKKAKGVIDYAKRSKSAAGLGFTYGTAASAAHQAASEGNINWMEAIAVGGTTMIASPVLISGTRAAGAKIGRVRLAKHNELLQKATGDLSKKEARRLYNNMMDDFVDGMTTDRPSRLFPEEVVSVGGVARADKVSQAVSTKYAKALTDEQKFLDLAGEKAMPNIDFDGVKTATVLDQAGPAATWLRDTSRKGVKGLDFILGSMDTRLRNVSERLYGKVTRAQLQTMRTAHARETTITDTNKVLETALGKKGAKDAWRLLHDGQWDDVLQALEGSSHSVSKKRVEDLRVLLDDMADEQKLANMIGNKENPVLNNYFPHRVKNLDGLMRALGKTDEVGIIEEAWKAEAKKIGHELTSYEKATVAGKILRDKGIRLNRKLDQQNKRSIKNIDGLEQALGVDIRKYYHDPVDSLVMYMRDTTVEIDKRKFLAQLAPDSRISKQLKEDVLDEGIAKIVTDEIGAGRLKGWQQDEATRLLQTMFGQGLRHPSKWVSTTKAAAYTTLIGNPISAVQQFGDVGLSFALHGPMNTAKSILNLSASKVGGTRLLEKVEAHGIAAPAHDIATGGVHHFLTRTLKGVGFTSVDRGMKNISANAALRKGINAVASPKGRKAMLAEYTKGWGIDDASQLVTDMRNFSKTKEVTPLMSEYAILKLSGQQPIASAALPEAYAKYPNGRLLYTLATWALRFVDVARKEGYNKIANGLKSGDVKMAASGATKIAELGLMVGTLDAGIDYIQDAMRGRDLYVEDFPPKVWESTMQLFTLGMYGGGRYDTSSKGPITSIIGRVPAMAIPNKADQLTAPITAPLMAEEGARGEAFGEGMVDFLSAFPGFGPFVKGSPLHRDTEYNERKAKEMDKRKEARPFGTRPTLNRLHGRN